MVAGGALPGWAVGMSIFGTFLSSNTFIGVPGQAFGGNWNAFVFSLSLPVAAFLAARWWIPFYRRHHLEARFGRWARTYAVACYLLTQFARVGSILFGVALAMNALTGWPVAWIILSTGVVVTIYTLIGGIEAVIWTDVIQSVVLTVGALFVVGLLIVDAPGGLGGLVEAANSAESSFAFDFTTSTFWVVLIYGLFINFNNFGIDQSYVQRYHAANSDRAASRSVWLAAGLYLPVSAVFFFIGTGLFVVFQGQPEVAGVAADQAFPHYISTRLPAGAAGLLIAALFAAAMSSIDTSLNSSATVFLSDLYRTYIRPEPDPDGVEAEDLRVLRRATVGVGVLGTSAALLMIGAGSLLDVWWTWSGVFAGGLLGLFALDRLAPRAGRAAAQLGVAVGVLVIVWMTASPRLDGGLAMLRNPLHSYMVTVIGTLTIFGVGLLVSRWRRLRGAAIV
ncbi:MAG: sodium:solute symporter [Acidobacteria bacterium]|nr:sodium:solute symporter [Acidobacteriota bacterium]